MNSLFGMNIICLNCDKVLVHVPKSMAHVDDVEAVITRMLRKAGALAVDGDAWCDQACRELDQEKAV